MRSMPVLLAGPALQACLTASVPCLHAVPPPAHSLCRPHGAPSPCPLPHPAWPQPLPHPPRLAGKFNELLGYSGNCTACPASGAYTSYAASQQCDVEKVDLECRGGEHHGLCVCVCM